MKKLVSILLVLSCLFLSSFNTMALEDTTPPTLTSIQIDKKSLNGGDKLKFSIKGEDDLSGLNHIMIEYRLKSEPTRRISIEFDNKTTKNSFSATYQIPERLAPGEWVADAIQIWDGAWNLSTYMKSSGENDALFNNINFTLRETPGADHTPPVLKSIKLKNKTISAPGKIEIIAEVTDNKSSTVDVEITYMIRGSQWGFNAYKVSGKTYSGVLNVDSDAKYQTAKLGYIVLRDEAGNEAWYSYKPEDYPFGEASLKLTTNLDVSFSNSVTDNHPPVLKDYYYSSNVVTAPGSMKLYFDAADDISGVAQLNAIFIGVDSDGKTVDHVMFNPQFDEKTKKFVSDYTFDQYYPDAVYSIVKIEVIDGAGNKAVYAVEPGTEELVMKEKKVKLKKAIKGDVTTGTMDGDYIKKIKNAKDNAVITVDCTKNHTAKKEAFSAIKGTGKSMVLVNDGIQWIFKGTDILNAVKNINTKVNIYTFDAYGNQNVLGCFTEDADGIIIEFAPNGLLPGKALIKIKADYTFRNYIGEKDLYIYHYMENENGLEAIAEKIEMSPNGYYEFYILHNSKYIISKEKAKPAAVVKDSIKQLNDKEKDTESIVSSEKESSSAQSIRETSADEISTASFTSSPSVVSSETELNNSRMSIYIVFVILVIILSALLIIFRKQIIRWFRRFKKQP